MAHLLLALQNFTSNKQVNQTIAGFLLKRDVGVSPFRRLPQAHHSRASLTALSWSERQRLLVRHFTNQFIFFIFFSKEIIARK